MEAVGDHIRQEEFDMFTAIQSNLSDEQSEQLATEFKSAKAQIQQRMSNAS
jgi:hemerythrin-like domain-containing protein